MPAKTWTNDEQLTWLKFRIPEYLEAQSATRLTNFFTILIHDYLKLWPEHDILFPSDPAESTLRVLSTADEATLAKAIKTRKAVCIYLDKDLSSH
jgi:hypothetical protein